MPLPRMVITGASGFVGRHLLDAFKGKYTIIALARRSQSQSGAPIHPNILWNRVDIGDYDALAAIFNKIREGGGAEIFIHLAAYYDFTGDEHPEYMRSNVTGLRNVLTLSRRLGLKRFIFASSTAASRFPAHNGILNEESQPDGEHIYARTKKLGEEMLREFADSVPSCIVRFAALFSDWCEYPPMYMFFNSWLSDTWTSRVLAGKGQSSVPFLHIHDIVSFFKNLVSRINEIENVEVFMASTDGSVTHKELFDTATLSYYGERKVPVYLPKILCRPGIHARRLMGNFSGYRPFESPWMCKYIDLQMNIDASRTRTRLNWNPRPRLEIKRRIPFMIENLRSEPMTWHTRNSAALRKVPLVAHLKIHNLMKAHEREIKAAVSERVLGQNGQGKFQNYIDMDPEQSRQSHSQMFHNLANAIRTRDKSLFRAYCQEVAEHRIEQGFSLKEICDVIAVWNSVCLDILDRDPLSKDLPKNALRDNITMTLQFGIDEFQEVYEQLRGGEYPINLLEN